MAAVARDPGGSEASAEPAGARTRGFCNLPIVGDVREDASVEAAVAQTVETFGGIDICLNNASAIGLTGTLDTSLVSTDYINNPRTMNAVYSIGARLAPSLRWAKEQLEGGELDNAQFQDFPQTQALKDFWDEATAKSSCQASNENGTPPTEEMPSTRVRAPWARATEAISATGFNTPVLVSECATSTARDPGLALRADRTSSGSALLSQSWATRRTVRPYRSPNPAHISPNRPLQTATRVSPGRKKLTTAPSMAARPVPWIGRMSAEAVPKRGRAPSMSSERAKENSGVRWWRTR